MKTFVTGGTGFTGSHLVRRLLDAGHDVRVVDNQEGLFFNELKEAGAEMHLGSITDRALVEKCTEGVEVVFHVAAAFRQLDVPDSFYWDVNVEGTRNVAEAALKAGVRRLVYCSTQGVHGHIEDAPGDEESPIAPEDYYQETKYEGEKVILAYCERGLDAVILRPTAIYGPGDPARFLMLFRMARKGSFLMFGNGETTYHPLYIDNLVDAFLSAGEGKGPTGESYIIGDEHYYTLDDLVRHVGRAMGIDVRIRHLPFRPLWLAAVVCEAICKPLRLNPPLFRRRVDWFRQVRAFRIDKAKRDLGYEPRVGIEEGLAKTGEWYREHGYI